MTRIVVDPFAPLVAATRRLADQLQSATGSLRAALDVHRGGRELRREGGVRTLGGGGTLFLEDASGLRVEVGEVQFEADVRIGRPRPCREVIDVVAHCVEVPVTVSPARVEVRHGWQDVPGCPPPGGNARQRRKRLRFATRWYEGRFGSWTDSMGVADDAAAGRLAEQMAAAMSAPRPARPPCECGLPAADHDWVCECQDYRPVGAP